MNTEPTLLYLNIEEVEMFDNDSTILYVNIAEETFEADESSKALFMGVV